MRDMYRRSKKYWMDSSIDGSTFPFFDSFISITPWAIVCTTSECRSRIFTRSWQNLRIREISSASLHDHLNENRFYFSIFVVVGSSVSYCSTSSKLLAYQALTKPIDGVRDRLSGSNVISFMILANRTGSSFRRKIYDFFSHAFKPETAMRGRQKERNLR